MRHIASVSFGKDSLAMLLMLIKKGMPLDEVVFYDTGKEFQAIYALRDKVSHLLAERGIIFTELRPTKPFDYYAFEHITKSGESGYGWCGGVCRWGTSEKTRALDKHNSGAVVYVGIATDETSRIKKGYAGHIKLPLVGWNVTEQDCLRYCRAAGYNWHEGEIDLYDILDRVSCWCCRNKNLKELRNIYKYLPEYWERLKAMQARIARPMKGPGKSVFELEERFKAELSQMKMGV